MDRFVRFMGMKELIDYLSGKTLVNTIAWREKAQNTDSVGFCFFDGTVEPEKRMDYLTGVVDMDIVAEFNPVAPISFKRSFGMYRDPAQDMPETLFDALFSSVKMMRVPEYSITQYSKDSMRLIRVGVPVIFPEHKIEWVGEEKFCERLVNEFGTEHGKTKRVFQESYC